jgi:hypothetical protein
MTLFLERSQCHEAAAYLKTERNLEILSSCTSSLRNVVAEFSADLSLSSMSSWRVTILLAS